MCGIVGIIRKNSDVELAEVQQMNSKQTHRGPDGEGFHLHGSVGIGHRRLSIIDLENGKQPMSTADSKLWITYNGELYNYLILKKELQSYGHVFNTHSDTEVILYAYRQWGKSCVTHFRGMFAFGIIDTDKKEVFIARDQFGIKPLIYRVSDNYLAFSSEINAVKATNDTPPKGNLKAIDLYLTLQYIPAPHTIYKNIFKLPAAHYMRVSFTAEILEKTQYHDLKFNPGKGLSADQWTEETEKVITESINAQLISDVPFGAFLSGGIDSTLVALKMSKFLDKPLKAFTIGFNEEEFSEIKYAERAAKEIGVELISEVITTNSLDVLPDLINKHYGEPFGDSSVLPTWHVSKLAKTEVKMALTGDGGDEMFGGYYSHTSWMNNAPLNIIKRKLRNNQWSGIPRFIAGSAKAYLNNNGSFNNQREWTTLMTSTKADMRKRLWKSNMAGKIGFDTLPFDHFHSRANKFERLSYAQYIDINTYLPDDILVKVDIASMANGLETRPPLIDIEVAKLVEQLPLREKHSLDLLEKQGKHVLKKILLKSFPEDFVYRKKQGFAIPSNHWFLEHKENSSFFAEHIIGAKSKLDRFFDKEYIGFLFEQYNSKQGKYEYFQPLWLLFVFSLWLNENDNIDFEE